MTITTNNVEWTWFIRRVSVRKSLDNFSNVITSASWALKAEYIDIENKEQYVEEYCSTSKFNLPSETNFIEYEYIDDDIIISWIQIEESESIGSIEEEIISKLNEQCGEEIYLVLNKDINN